MPEISIITRQEVHCPKYSLVPVALNLCIRCPEFRYQMVNGKVLCNYNGPTPLLPREPRDRGPKDSRPYKKYRWGGGYPERLLQKVKEISLDDLEKELSEHD